MCYEELENTSLEILNTIVVNCMFNSYAIECVTLGELAPTDSIPFEKYVKDLSLEKYLSCYRRDLSGYAIDENETVTKEEFDYFAKEFLYSALSTIFCDAPAYSSIENDDGLPDYKYGLRKYIKNLYPIFCKIAKTEAQVYFNGIAHLVDEYQRNNIHKFLFDIKVNGLKQGQCVSNYFSNIKFLPYYIKRLIEIKDGQFILINNNADSLAYKLALLSMVGFLNPIHTKLWENKIRQWENTSV